MNHAMTVDWDASKRYFLVRCPMWANDMVRQLPDRRWLKGAHAWAVPLMRINYEKIKEWLLQDAIQFSPEAKAALQKYVPPTVKAGGPGFPAWYPFKTVPFPPAAHQRKVLDKMWSRHCYALHHDMGTFKTRTYIDFACAKRMDGQIDAMLVVVKLSGRRNWKEQFVGPMVLSDGTFDFGWAPIPVEVYLPTTDDRRGFAKWMDLKHDFKVMVVGLESLSQGRMAQMMNAYVRAHGKVLMVVDESHLIANHKAIRTEACVAVGRECAWRGTGTGTPISVGPLNLFSQFEYLDPDIIGIGDFYAFRNQYAVIIEQKTKQGQKFPMLVGYKNLDELTKTVAPYVDEVRKADVLPDLPPKSYQRLYVTLTKEQQALYDQIRKEGAYLLKGKEVVVKNVLELALRLHTVCGGFAATYTEVPYTGAGGVAKIRKVPTWHAICPIERNPKLNELVEVCSGGKQFIVWAAYRAEVDAIVARLTAAYPKLRLCQIHGGVDEDTRARHRNEYQKGDFDGMVGNTATGGTADTWTACETMYYFNNTEKMVDRLQSEDRAHRGGLKHPVLYVDLIAEGTVDELIIKSIEQKVDLAEYLRMNIRKAAELING